MKIIIHTLVCIVAATSLSCSEAPAALKIEPNCAPIQAAPSKWAVALCKRPETQDHDYPTEIRFSRKGKPVFSYVYLSPPSGGYAKAELLAATDRLALLEIPGDEANQLMAFDLNKKSVVFNTGYVVGMNHCTVNALGDDVFCRMSVTCPVGPSDDSSKNYAAHISEFLCDGK